MKARRRHLTSIPSKYAIKIPMVIDNCHERQKKMMLKFIA